MVSIDLGRRFGVVGPDLTKARKGKPDSGLDWRGYNAANPTETQKDSRGRWTDNPVGRAIAQAYSNVRARPHTSSAPSSLQYKGGEEEVGVKDIRDELTAMGHTFSREEVDAELLRLSSGEAPNFEPDFVPYPVSYPSHWSGQHALLEEYRAAGFEMGNQNKVFLQPNEGVRFPAPSKPGAPSSGRYVSDAFKMDPSPLAPSTEPWKAARANMARQMGETADGDMSDWDEAELTAARDAAKRLATAADAALKAKRAKAKATSRATARVKAKPEPDYEHMVTAMRGLPVLPESDDAARRAIEPLTIPELKALAQTAGVPVGSKARKQDIRDAIVGQLIGSRLTTDAVMNYGDPGRFDRRRAEADGVSGLERLMGGRWETKPTPSAPARPGVESAVSQIRHAQNAGPHHGREQSVADLLGSLAPDQMDEVAAEFGMKVFGRDDTEKRHTLASRLVGRLQGHPDSDFEGTVLDTRSGRSAPPTRAPRATKPVPHDEIAAMVASPKPEDRERLRGILTTMTLPQLQEVANRHGSGIITGTNKQQKVGRLVENLIGFRLNSEAIQGGGWSPEVRRRGDAADVAAQLQALDIGDSQATGKARAMLAGLTIPQLREVSSAVGPTAKLPAKATKQQMVDRIVEGTVGFRQRAEAINPGGVARRTADRDASLRHAEAQLDEMRADLEGLYGEDPDRWPEARQDSQVEAYWDQRERVDRLRSQEKQNDAGSTKQSPEMTRAQVMQAYAALSREPGALVSLVKLRAALPDVSHDELTAVLKQMDRERIIHLRRS